GRLWPDIASPLHRAGTQASLAAWHQALDPVSRFGWIMINSSGFARRFAITGGSGLPADLPRGRPAAISIIHSFSASDPLDTSTLAGRWLENGAYIYFGAMNEPYLIAFRTPRLIAELASAEIPLGALLRQGEVEPLGRPWRLVYLGDPLYHFRSLNVQAHQGRIAPGLAPGETIMHTGRSALVITASSPLRDLGSDESAQLQSCLAAAIATLCRPDRDVEGSVHNSASHHEPPPWLAVLATMDRHRLDPTLRPVLDELMIDTLLSRGDLTRLFDWLKSIPPDECGARLRDAIETTAMSRLAALVCEQSVSSVLDLWEEMVRRPWPAGSPFPAQLTGRLAEIVATDPARYREPYRQRLIRTAAVLGSGQGREMLATELNRLESTARPAK
ncbi:MAG: hypothetical protein ACP5XB_31765, partial [Isosphaeraceae bacterium]